MSNGATLYVHVGPPKTATTFLQEHVLKRVSSVECRCLPEVQLGGEAVNFGHLFSMSPSVWTEHGGRAFAQLINETERADGEDLIVSHEGIHGGMATPRPWLTKEGGWAQGVEYGPLVRLHTDGRPHVALLTEHLTVLSDVAARWGFAEVKVLATLRRQDSWLASEYAQNSHKIRGASQENFEAWVREVTSTSLGRCAGGGEKLDYSSWWEAVGNAVGKENVFLLPFELLKENQTAFLNQWLSFLGVEERAQIIGALSSAEDEENRRSTSSSRWALRPPVRTGPSLWPRVTWKLGLPTKLPMRWPDFARESSIRLTPELSERILTTYADGNRRLDEAVPHLELEAYGYH